MRTSLALSFLLVALLAGCSGDDAAPAPAPEPTAAPTPDAPAPTCPVTGVVSHHHEDDHPLAGVRVTGRASEEVDGSLRRGVAEQSTTTDAAGAFTLELPCGSMVLLEVEGWVWPVHPADLVAEPAAAPLDVVVMPARRVRLWIAGDPGEPVEGARFVPAGGGPAQDIPFEGLELEGLPYGQVAGTIEADGRPPRTWRVSRSDTLAEVGPMVFEATVHMGDEAPLWIELPSREVREVAGAWCVVDGARGERCKLRDGGFQCPCVEQRVALAAERWDVGIVRDVVQRDLAFEALPEAVEQCLVVGDAERVRVHPDGVDDVTLLGKRGPADRFCLKLPAGQPVRVVPDGEEQGLRHVPDAPGDVLLR